MTLAVSEPKISDIVNAAIAEHGAGRDALIPILGEINRVYGYVPAEAFKEIRQQMNDGVPLAVSESQIFSVASFYELLSTKPVGRNVVRYCESAPCHVQGGREFFQALKDALQIEPDETSPDNRWTLITTSCLGVCGVGPVILINDDIYGNLTADQLPQILAKYE